MTLYFLSFVDGNLREQGRVLTISQTGATVDLYDWVTGRPIERKVIPIAEMTNWELFESAAGWRERGTALVMRDLRALIERDASGRPSRPQKC